MLTVVQPGLLDDVADVVADVLGNADLATREKILKLVDGFPVPVLDHRIVGLVVALYTGAKWMGHLKNAVRTQWRPGFDLRPQKINIVLKTLGNLLILAGFMVGMAVSFGLASLSTSFANTRWSDGSGLAINPDSAVAPDQLDRILDRRRADLHVSVYCPSGDA